MLKGCWDVVDVKFSLVSENAGIWQECKLLPFNRDFTEAFIGLCLFKRMFYDGMGENIEIHAGFNLLQQEP